jgi:hypothetical protein
MEIISLKSNRATLSTLSPEEKRNLYITGLRMPQHWKQREAFLQQEPIIKGIVNKKQMALQTVHTPFSLCEEMIRKLTEYTGYLENKKILVYNVEFLDILYRMGIMWNNEIWFVNENPQQIQFARDIYVGDGNDKFICSKFLEIDKNMKFDVIVGNPPFSSRSDIGNVKTQPIWPKFVERAIELCNPNGYICLTHPSGWRDVDGNFKNTQELLLSKDMKYLELHDSFEGVETFGVQTAYDYYIVKNSDRAALTTVVGLDGKTSQVDMSNIKFIPNGMYDEIMSLFAKEGEEKVEILHSYSAYESRKEYVSKEKINDFRYPIIYTTEKDGTINTWYSQIKTKGHFGIPKVFWSNGSASSVHVDISGEYGLTQFAYAIVDVPENLENIKKALQNPKFLEIMKYCDLGTRHRYNRKVISMFRKDFWKQFVNENGKEI